MQHTHLLLDSQQVTPMTSPLFTPAIAAIDACNAEDPRQDQDEQGRTVPYELLYSQRMSQELARFVPQASEALQLAARAQHLAEILLMDADATQAVETLDDQSGQPVELLNRRREGRQP